MNSWRTDPVRNFIKRRGELITSEITPTGITADAVKGRLAWLLKQGRLIRRRVVLKDDSALALWAYRIPSAPEKIKSFALVERDPVSKRPVTAKYPKPNPLFEEPEWAYYLRTFSMPDEIKQKKLVVTKWNRRVHKGDISIKGGDC